MNPTDPINDRFCLSRPPFGEPTMTLEQALQDRRSAREFRAEPLTLAALSRLLWAMQGRTSDGHRTAPSAGSTFPLEVYVAVGAVEGLPRGLYHYVQETHEVARRIFEDVRRDLYAATVGQTGLAEAPVTLVLAAAYERTTARYSTRGMSYTLIEAGHATQNLCLEATVLGLGVATVGAFRDDLVRSAIDLPGSEHPIYLLPVGRPA